MRISDWSSDVCSSDLVLDDSRHLAWGYVAYPPVVPFLAHASMALFGDSLAAYRAPSALAQALATLLAGLIARELGGGRFPPVTAAVAVCCSPFPMLAGSKIGRERCRERGWE